MKVFIADMNRSCTSNSYHSACLRAFCENNGFAAAASQSEADTVIVNGCNVVSRNWELVSALRELAGRRAGLKVIAFGCTPTLDRPRTSSGPGFRVLPLHEVLRKPQLLGRALGASKPFKFLRMDEALKGRVFAKQEAHLPRLKGLFYLRISDGCRGNCAFCALRQAKGRVKSAPLPEIAEEFRSGLKKGKKRFFLISDDAPSWGRDKGTDLAALIRRLVRISPEAGFISTTFNPHSLAPVMGGLMPFMKNFEHLSVPIQSGNDRILGLMRRNYTSARAMSMVERIRKANPRIRLNTDVIVGYPSETWDEFMDSVGTASRFDSAFFFMFTPYPHTPAAELKGRIGRDEMRRRFGVIRKLRKKHRFLDDFRDEPRGREKGL